MALVNLPSVKDAKTIEEVIDVVENMRKQMEFLFSNVQNDNINGTINAEKIVVGAASTFDPGYDPSTIKGDTKAITDGLQTQIDGKVETFFYAGVPSLVNIPASDWADNATKDVHIGDLYYDTATGKAYRFKVVTGTYSWENVQDNDIVTALTNASKAQDTADGKRRVFTAQPIPPYDVGDLWSQGPTGDLMRCKTAKATGSYATSDWEKAVKYTDDGALANYVTSSTYNGDKSALQTQIDGKVETWFYSGVPTLVNTPASGWADNATKDIHTGDLYYDTATGKVYRFKLVTGTYSWEYLQDSSIQTALTNASTAQSTADRKKVVFTVQPTTPYDVGDLWAGGSTSDLMVCKVARPTGAYTASDWQKAVKYTDDGSLANYVTSSTYSTDKSSMQTDIDGKMESWFYSGVPTLANTPASAWTDNPTKDKHLGDLYYDIATKKVYRFKVVTGAYSWELLQDADIQSALSNASTAQSTADSKMQVFTAQPVPPYDIGDLWAGGSTTDLMKCKVARLTGSYVAADWEKAVKYTDDSSLAGYVTSATYNGGISGLQTQIDGKVETWFYSGVPTLANTPASTWTDNATKDIHINDLYFDMATKKIYRFKVVTGTYSWELLQDSDIQTALTNASTAQSTADKKMVVFTSTPTTPYDIGDLWVQGTSSDLMKCKVARASGAYVAADWEKAVKYTDDTKANQVGTYIDGTGVYTGTVTANQITTGTLSAITINGVTINGSTITSSWSDKKIQMIDGTLISTNLTYNQTVKVNANRITFDDGAGHTGEIYYIGGKMWFTGNGASGSGGLFTFNRDIEAQEGYYNVGLKSAYSWSGSLAAASGSVNIVHNLGYNPMVTAYGTAGNLELTYTVNVSGTSIYVTNYSSGSNVWTGTVYLW